MPHAAKLEVLEQRLRTPSRAVRPTASGKRVQKNLTILERDAVRLKALAKRESISQARLLSLALDAYESQHGSLTLEIPAT